MSEKNPKVSVLTPIYNTNPQYLREMIESILNQTFKDFEFLILNDSPDNKEIENIVKEYAKKDKRVKYYKNEKNLGITPSRNKLLKMAKGEYIAVFDHDDISLPERLEKQVKFLDENKHIGVVSSWVQIFGDSNNLSKSPERDFKIRACLTETSCVAHTAAMIRKSILIDNNIEYEESYTPCEDYKLWARLMEVTCFYNIQEALVKYRCFKQNTSNRLKTNMSDVGKMIQWQIISKHPLLHQTYKKHFHRGTVFKLRLFGFVPFLKIRNNWVLLFEIIPLFKTRWK